MVMPLLKMVLQGIPETAMLARLIWLDINKPCLDELGTVQMRDL